jgi:aminoglycoside 6'-N-acetyltransferase
MSLNAITFMPVTDAHRPLLLRWLSSPHAQEWWGNPQEELELIYDGKVEHQPFLACINDEPIAYIQAWWPSKHPDLPWQHAMTPTTRGIDITIGDEKNLGKGYGSHFIKHFAAKLFAEGATRLIIDPDISNDRAVSAYMKAGFTPYETYATSDGTDLLMEMFPEDLDYGHGHAQT